jgi:hypothetical protein
MWLIHRYKTLEVHEVSSERSRVSVVKAATFDGANSVLYDAVRPGPVQSRMVKWVLAWGEFQRKRRDPNGNNIPAFTANMKKVTKNFLGYFEIWREILPNTKFYAVSSIKLGSSFFRHVAANHWVTGAWPFETTWWSHPQESSVQWGIKHTMTQHSWLDIWYLTMPPLYQLQGPQSFLKSQ